jgi:hypothetical protein
VVRPRVAALLRQAASLLARLLPLAGLAHGLKGHHGVRDGIIRGEVFRFEEDMPDLVGVVIAQIVAGDLLEKKAAVSMRDLEKFLKFGDGEGLETTWGVFDNTFVL